MAFSLTRRRRRRPDPETAAKLAECEAQRRQLLREAEDLHREIAFLSKIRRGMRRDTRRLANLADRHGIRP